MAKAALLTSAAQSPLVDSLAHSPLRIIRLPEVMRRVGESRSTIYDKIANREFPRPVKLGEKAVGWVETEITQYIQAKIAARDGKAAA